MLRTTFLLVATLLIAPGLSTAQMPDGAENNWHQWRGPLATGEAPTGNPPTEWSADKNIVWKAAIPGKGSSSPIIWGDRIYLTTAIKGDETGEAETAQADPPPPPPRGEGGRFGGRGGRGFGRGGPPTTEYEFVVLCLDRNTGEVIWQKTAAKQVPHEGIHSTNSYASASPITDGEHLYVFFGSFGLYCYDMEGNLKWEKDLGDMQTRASFGEGASPALYGDTLIVPWDHEGPSFIAALDATNGDIKWKQERDEPTTWNTPLVIEAAGRTQVIVNGTNRSRSYDFETGEVIWECGGQVTNPIPAPMAYNGVVFCMSGHRGEALYAISLDATGDVTDSDSVAWSRNRGIPYVPSALLMNGRLYFTKGNNGILSILDASTGEAFVDQKRLSGISNIYASPVGAAGKVYITSRDGATAVLKDGTELEILATNELGEAVDASPAIVGSKIYIRGESNLYCIGEGE